MAKSSYLVTLVLFVALFASSAALAAQPESTQTQRPHSKSVRLKKPVHVAKAHRVVIQVDQNDPAIMNLALNNASNVVEYYRSKGEDVSVDIVTYGPGLHMLRADTSPVRDRIAHFKDTVFPSKVQFSACGNTKQNMEKAEGHPIEVVKDAVVVPSGVVHLMELQEKGWSYVRP